MSFESANKIFDENNATQDGDLLTEFERQQRSEATVLAAQAPVPQPAQVRQDSQDLGVPPELGANMPDLSNRAAQRRLARQLEGDSALLQLMKRDQLTGSAVTEDVEALQNTREAIMQHLFLKQAEFDEQGVVDRNVINPLREVWQRMQEGGETEAVLGRADMASRSPAERSRLGGPLADPGSLAFDPELAAQADDRFSDGAPVKIQGSLNELERVEKILKSIPRDSEFEQRIASDDVGGILGSIADDPSRAWRLVLSGIGYSAPSLVVGLFSGPAAPFTAAATSFLVEQQSAMTEALQRRNIKLSDMTPENVILTLSNPELREEFDDAAGEAVRKAQGVALWDLISFGVASKMLAPAKISGKALTFRQQAAMNLLIQAPLQGVFEGAGEATGQVLATGEVKIGEVLVEAIAGAGSSVSDVAVFGTKNLVQIYGEATAAKQALDAYRSSAVNSSKRVQEVVKIARETQAFQDDPELLREYLQSMLGDDDGVLIAPEALIEFLQATNEDTDTILESLGLTSEELTEATARGAYVDVSIADLSSAQLGLEVLAAVEQDTKLNYDDMTVNEVAAIETMSANEVAQILADQESVGSRDSTATDVSADVYSQLIALGQGPQEARAYAKLWESTMAATAARLGVTAKELYEQYRPTITDQEPRDLIAGVDAGTDGTVLGDADVDAAVADVDAPGMPAPLLPIQLDQGPVPVQVSDADFNGTDPETGDHAGRISTRRPSGPNATESADTANLTIDAGQVKKAFGKRWAAAATRLKSYVGFKTKKRNPDAIVEDFIEHAVGNLLWLHDQIPAEKRERARLWYEGARDIATRFATRYEVSDIAVAGVMAALSPQKDWFQNVSLAERVLDVHTQFTTGNMVAFIAPAEMLEVASAKFHKLDPAELAAKMAIPYAEQANARDKAMWLRVYDETYHSRENMVVTPEGRFTSEVSSKTGWGSLVEIGKAIEILSDPNRESASQLMGGAHKVRNFFNNILAPLSPHGDVTIDTHAVAASLLKPLSGNSIEVLHNFGATKKGHVGFGDAVAGGIKGSYGIYATAYRRAAEQRGILPREMQSITWEAVRVLFPAKWKTAKNGAAVEEVWSRYEAGTIGIDLVREEIKELADGFEAFAWESTESDSADAEGVRTTTYDRELPALGVRGRDAAGGVGSGSRAAVGAADAGGPGGDSGTGGRSGAARVPAKAKPSQKRTQARITEYKQSGTSDHPGVDRLPGLPMSSPGGLLELQAAASIYAERAGIEHQRQGEYVQVDVERAERLAAAYEDMPHEPDAPLVKEAYRQLIEQTLEQYQVLKAQGWTFRRITDDTGNPYEETGPSGLFADLRDNRTLWFYPSEDGFGPDGTVSSDNPLMELTDEYLDGERLVANDVFRIVHDMFGHGLEGAQFRARGEENAWQAHSRLFHGLALGAVTTETRGQNSWVNYGPHGESNKTATADTIFADQKTGLMPEWTWHEGRASDAEAVHNPVESIDDFFQQATETDAFLAWDRGGVVRDNRGNPVVVYRGSNRDTPIIDAADSDPNGDVGRGNYFSSSLDDVNANYARKYGPDRQARAESAITAEDEAAALAELEADPLGYDATVAQLSEDLGLVIDADDAFDAAYRLAVRKEIDARPNQVNIMPVFVRFDAPAVLNDKGDGGTLLAVEDILSAIEASDQAANIKRSLSAQVENAAISDSLHAYQLIQLMSFIVGKGKLTGELFRAMGFDGIIDHTVARRFAGMEGMTPDAVHYITFPSTNQKSAIGNNGNFDPNDALVVNQDQETERRPAKKEGKARGKFSITEDRNTRIIALFDGADRSTFLHESAHFFLEMYRDIDAQGNALHADVQQLFKILEISGWDDIGVKQHEQFAESFEKYLFEGNAPTEELRSLFRTFSDWLRSVYRKLSSIGITKIELDQDMRDFMDRLVAGDDVITVESRRGPYLPAFNTSEAAGLTPAEYESYRTRIAGPVVERAREKMIARLLKDVTKANRAARKDALATARVEASVELASMSSWRALTYLRNGLRLEKDGSAEETPQHIRLDGTQVEAMVGAERKALLPRITQKADGLDVDVVAQMFGFDAGATMLETIEAMRGEEGKIPSLKQQVEVMARATVDESSETTLDPERLSTMAIDAMQNVERGEMLAFELQLLKEKRSKDARRSGERRAIETQPGVAPSEFEERLRVARRAVDAAGAFGDAEAGQQAMLEVRVIEEERDASRLLNEASRSRIRNAGNALRFKQKEMKAAALAYVLALPVSALSARMRYSADQRRAGVEASKAIAAGDWDTAHDAKERELLNHYIYVQMDRANIQNLSAQRLFKKWQKSVPKKTAAGVEHGKRIREILHAYGYESAAGDMAEIALWVQLQNDGGESIVIPAGVLEEPGVMKDQPVQRLYDVRDAVRSLSRNGSKGSAAERAEFQERIDGLIAGMETNVRTDREELGRIAGKWRDFADLATLGHRKAEHLFNQLDGFDRVGPIWEALFKPISRATDTENQMRDKATQDFRGLFAMLGALDKGWQVRNLNFSGRNFSQEERIVVALNWGNEDNRAALLNGSRGWTQGQLDDVINSITEEEWKFVTSTWAYIDTYWPAIAAMEAKLTGVIPKKVEGDSFVTLNGDEIAGGYYPIMFDFKLSLRSNTDALDQQAKELMSGTSLRASTRHGHTKQRSGSKDSGKRVLLSLDGVFKHVDQVIHDISMREAVLEVNRVLQNREFQAALDQRYGSTVLTMLDGWLKNVAAGETQPVDMVNAIARYTRVGMSMAEMGFSIRTALVQPLGITNVVSRIGIVDTLRGIAAMVQHMMSGNPLRAVQAINSVSPYMSSRSDTFDRDLRSAAHGLTTTKLDVLKSAAFWHIGKLDMLVSYSAWNGAYGKAIREGLSIEKAQDYADVTVRQTQGSGLQQDLAAVQRGTETMKLFTSFYTFFAAYQNMVQDATQQNRKLREEGRIGAASFHAANQFFWLVAAPSMLTSIVLDGKSDDDEEYWKWASRIMAQYGLGGMVIMRDVASGLFSDFGYGGPASFRVYDTGISFVDQAGQGELDKALVRAGVLSVSYFGHIPGGRQAWRTIETMWDLSEGKEPIKAAAGFAGLRHFK